MNSVTKTQLRIPDGIYRAVCERARNQNRSINSILVESIDAGIRKAPPPAKVSEALTLITNIVRGNQHDKR